MILTMMTHQPVGPQGLVRTRGLAEHIKKLETRTRQQLRGAVMGQVCAHAAVIEARADLEKLDAARALFKSLTHQNHHRARLS